jgi:hypothetical protein
MPSLRRRLAAWVALAAFSGFFGLGWAGGHLNGDDDAACGPNPLSGAHASIQFENVKTTPIATHCPFCHWQRAVSGAHLSALHTSLFSLEPIDRLIPAGFRAARSAILDRQASRGPPAIL